MSDKKKEFKITKVGPIYRLEGFIGFLHPYKTKSLDDYFEIETEKDFYIPLEKVITEWFDKFPNCCRSHEELSTYIIGFDKSEYSFITQQVVDNLKYFLHCLYIYADNENWYEEITEYLEYLIDSLGIPALGGHIFEQAVTIVVETFDFKNKKFTDDQKIEILAFIEHDNEIIREEDDLIVLYEAFQKWLEFMPNVGGFIPLKNNLRGKIPMNVFMNEQKYNKYSGSIKSRLRSKSNLIEYLTDLTRKTLSEIEKCILGDINDNDYKVIKAAEDRLNVKQAMLLNDLQGSNEFNYLQLIKEWLDNEIEYFTIISNEIQHDISLLVKKDTSEIKEMTNDVLSMHEKLTLEVSALSDKLPSVNDWYKKNFSKTISTAIEPLVEEVESLKDENTIKGLEDMLVNMMAEIKASDESGGEKEQMAEEIESADISIKHKIKLSIPLFIGVKYEGEIELSDKQKFPRSLEEVRRIFKR